MSNLVRIVTHSGSFHPDDVFSGALFSILFDGNIEIIRSRDPEIIKTGDYVFDVGGLSDGEKNFDHHQEGGAGERENGIPYASFGLVWKRFGEEIIEKVLNGGVPLGGAEDFKIPPLADSGLPLIKGDLMQQGLNSSFLKGGGESASRRIFLQIDNRLVSPIDSMDNGVGELKPIFADAYPYTIGTVIFRQNPTWKEKDKNRDDIFRELIPWARKIIEREIKAVADELEGEAKVKEAYENAPDKKIIVMDDNYPWLNVLNKFPEPLFAIEPSKDRERWEAEAVKEDIFSFKNRKNFPASWAGKRDEELQKITGVPDALFCHNKLFFAVARTKEGALSLATLALLS